MSHMARYFLFMGFLLSLTADVRAQQFTLWEDQTFNGPFVDGVIARSAEITNSPSRNGVRVVVQYKAIVPAQCNCQVEFIIEEEIANGVWVPIAGQNQAINDGLNAPTRVVVASPHFVSNPGGDLFLAVGGGVRISDYDVVLPDVFRVSVLAVEDPASPLTSVTVSGYGRRFDQ